MNGVAQICNLLYRRFVIGKPSDLPGVVPAGVAPAECNSALQQIINLRYSKKHTKLHRFFWLAVLVFAPAARLFAQPAALEEGRTRFCVVDIYVHSRTTPLAAYQLQFAVTNGAAKIIGIEGGEHPAFREPPFYDPKAMQHERVIIAAFNTGSADQLPSGKTRVATIHLQISASEPGPLQCELKLQAVGNAEGVRINAAASFQERKLP